MREGGVRVGIIIEGNCLCVERQPAVHATTGQHATVHAIQQLTTASHHQYQSTAKQRGARQKKKL